MIAKAPKAGGYGTNTAGVLHYLFGRGRANEHTNPHLIAAWNPEWLADGALADILDRRGGLARLARHLDANMTGHDVDVPGGHVYHVSLSVHPRDGQLGDAAWRQLVEDAIEHMGFGPDEHGRRGCRWVAVHHGLNTTGCDHVHLVVNLVRGDGRIASTYRDWPRWRNWCRAVENRHPRLTPTSPAGAGLPAESRPEVERARRHAGGTERDQLRRRVHRVAAASTSELVFVRRLAQDGLRYQPRLSSDRAAVIGYSVALPSATDRPLWLSGSSLRRDLSLPRLRAGWRDTPEVTALAAKLWTGQSTERVQEQLQLHADAPRPDWGGIDAQLRTASSRLADSLACDPHASARWHQAAAYTADLVTVLALYAGQPHQLYAAGDLLARAGQVPRGKRPPQDTHPVVSLLLDTARLAVACATPEPVVLAAILLLAYGIVRLLAHLAEQHRIHAAARRYLHRAESQLAEHPALQPATPAKVAAASQAAGALTPPSRRGTGGRQQPPVTQTHGAAPRRHWQKVSPTAGYPTLCCAPGCSPHLGYWTS